MPSEFNRFLSIAPALEAAGAEHMSEDEIVAEVKATRAEHVLPLARRRIRRRMVLDTKMVISALL